LCVLQCRREGDGDEKVPRGDLGIDLWSSIDAEEQQIQQRQEHELERERRCELAAEGAAVQSRAIERQCPSKGTAAGAISVTSAREASCCSKSIA